MPAKSSARTRSAITARARPALLLNSARTLAHVKQPAVLTPRDELMAGTRALPEQTHADRLLEKHSETLAALKADPSEFAALRTKLTPREPLTLALRAQLKERDARIAELEAKLRATAYRTEPTPKVKAAADDTESKQDSLDGAASPGQPESPVSLSTPPRTPIGDRPFQMSPTNRTGVSFLVAAFAEEEEERLRAAAALAAAQEERAALTAFERQAKEQSRLEQSNVRRRQQRVPLNSMNARPCSLADCLQVDSTSNAREMSPVETTRRTHVRYVAPRPSHKSHSPERVTDENEECFVNKLDLERALSLEGSAAAGSEPTKAARRPGALLGTPLMGSFSERMNFTSAVKPVLLATPRSPCVF